MGRKAASINPELVKELLDYERETGEFTWRKRGRKWFDSDRKWMAWNQRYAGKKAGGKWRAKDGYVYWLITLTGQRCLAHRLAWAWVTGEDPPGQIDHMDWNTLNNRFENLADGSSGKNEKNQCLPSNNTSGAVGVVWDKQREKWKAQIKSGGKVRTIGRFALFHEACEASRNARIESGFSPRHGSPGSKTA